MKMSTVSTLSILGVLELALALAASQVVSRDETYLLYVALYVAMGGPWLLASHYIINHPSDSAALRLVVGIVAVALRIVFLMTDPVLSDDIYRYVWDGRVQHAGINPYAFAPDAVELEPLRAGHEAMYQGINNKDIPTIYPPFMQIAFFAVTALSVEIVWMKAFFVLTDLLLVLVLAQLLGAVGLAPARSLIYAWSPLPVVEIAGSGHNDALAVLLLVAALSAIVQHRDALGMVLLTLSGMAKIIAFALAPLYVRSVRARALAWIPLVTVVLAIPYAAAGSLAFRGLTEYGTRWRGNDSVFHVLVALTGSLDTPKVIVAVLLVGMTLVLVKRRTPPLRASYLIVGAILILTTTVHPWYLLWMAPFLVLYPSPAWLYLSLAIVLGYHSAYLSVPGQPWEDVVSIKLMEYVPFFALGIWGLVTRRPFLELHSPP